MNKKTIIIVIALLLIVIGGFLINFSNQKPTAPSNKIKVAASFYPLYFFAQQIGGNKADITNITPAGAEPHDYEPTAQDIAKIETSSMLVLNGGGLEAWGSDIQQNLNAHS